MGNGLARLAPCCPCGGSPSGGGRRRRYGAAAVTWDPCDEGFGHSFCYIRPEAVPSYSGLPSVCSTVRAVASEETTMFRSISGAAVSANASTPLSTSILDTSEPTAASAFESSTSFSSVPLQPVPRLSGPFSGPIAASDRGFMFGPLERGFMSGPLERGFMSGPLDSRAATALFSAPLERQAGFSAPLEKKAGFSAQLRRSFSHGLAKPRRAAARSFVREATKAIARAISGSVPYGHGSIVAPVKAPKDSYLGDGHPENPRTEAAQWFDSLDSLNPNIQWAQGKAGEDRVHVVVSEERGWVFVGIYDGFNGPDATDYLLSNLYPAVHRELQGLLWDDKDSAFCRDPVPPPPPPASSRTRGATTRVRWQYEFEKERLELERRMKGQLQRMSPARAVNHKQVLEALARALKKTEESFLDIADKIVSENPELALMGSCVLVMLMKDDDVYLMNVGEARKSDTEWKTSQDIERIIEEAFSELRSCCPSDDLMNSEALQLTLEHSTCAAEEVARIRKSHPDDSSAILNGRVKGSLKVTRAFGAGFLKQPKWNNALLEMFRIDFVGTLPYITCDPFLCHHKLGPRDRFLILSSDGLYQYLTNEEAVAQVEMFIDTTPEGDPAQHLVEEVLFRAAKKAGMDFHELLEIPQGDRRRYHDDTSIIVISLEGKIWRSCT